MSIIIHAATVTGVLQSASDSSPANFVLNRELRVDFGAEGNAESERVGNHF
jgi:hypothetical protein